jgi:hypothetical protein
VLPVTAQLAVAAENGKKMREQLNLNRWSVVAALSLAVTACGGGGSDGGGPPEPGSSPAPTVPSPPPPAAAVNPDLVTDVAPATYAAGSVERGAWDLLQSQRRACGFGLLNQDTRLDTAAASHPFYLAQNTIDHPGTVYGGHFQDPAEAHFYGVAPWDRAARAGFPESVAEIFTATLRTYSNASPSPLVSDEALGRTRMRGMLHTVYHLSGAMWAGRHGGIGSANLTGPRSETRTQNMFVLDVVVSDESDDRKQKLGTGVLVTYPCDQLSGVGTSFAPADEEPNPFPDVADDSVLYGPPIYFKVDAGSTLEVMQARLATADGRDVPVRSLAPSNDPARILRANEFFIVPTNALASATSYTVTSSGSVNGTPFTKTFTFTTR